MLVIFSIINFALILLAFFFIILLYIKFSSVKQLEQQYRNLLQEAEDTITSYVMELKEENRNFLERLHEHSHEKGGPESEGFDEQEDKLSNSDLKELLQQESSEGNSKEAEFTQKPFEELNLMDKVLHLSQNGLTSEEIARSLDKGKTEIELLLKFRQ